MKIPKKPYNIQIELVRGCNLNCKFCGVQYLPKEKKFMDLDTLVNALSGVQDFDPIRIEFAMRGEPTLHKSLPSIVAITRTIMPKSQITLTTNGAKLTLNLAIKVLANGCNIILIDCYNDTFKYYKEKFKEFPLVVFGESKFNPWHRHKPDLKKICLLRDISKSAGAAAQRVILNQAGNVKHLPIPETPIKSICVHPFREVAVFWNGDVSICCRDWGEETILYNVNHRPIYYEWINNKKLNKVREKLFNKNRNFSICKRCDFHGGFMKGLIYGK